MGTAGTLARWLRRLADRLDPPRPRSPFEGQSSPIYLPSPTRIGIAPERTLIRVFSQSGALEGKRFSPVDPEYVFTERGLEPYRPPESGA